MLETALLLIFPAAMAFAGALDLLTMTIPNRISVVLAAAFAFAAYRAGLPPTLSQPTSVPPRWCWS